MTVYVESNFVLEIALGQEQASAAEAVLERLTLTVGRLLSMAIVIATDAAVFTEAMSIVDQIGLDPQDALIYASVLSHLRTSELPSPHYFINRNSRDFADPRIIAELRDLDCEFLRSFVEGALRLEQPLPD